MEKKLICINCNKEYELFCFDDFNLGLCPDCLDKFDKENKIAREEGIDIVKHDITCPLCKAKYGLGILNEQCKTEGCPVRFFWDDLDCVVMARWIK